MTLSLMQGLTRFVPAVEAGSQSDPSKRARTKFAILAGLLIWAGPFPVNGANAADFAAGGPANAAEENVVPTATAAVAVAVAREDVLSIRKGRFYLDGKPFAEISFNKFDLFWELYDQLNEGKPLDAANPLVRAQDRALRALHELGFRTIRIFALPWGPEGPASYADPQKRSRLYAALDKTVELCQAHDIRVVWSLGAGAFTDTKLDSVKGWVHGEEQLRELAANPNSRGRKLLYRYLDETVARYRHRKTILLWEISNEVTLQADIGDQDRIYEGERMPTLKEVAQFFDEVARRIKGTDPVRLVSSGGSNLRESQWHLYRGQGWKRDTFEEQFKCFELLYGQSAVDVIDIHSYPNGKPGYLIQDDAGKPVWLDNQGYMAMARRLHKPLMIGELGLQPASKTDRPARSATPDYFESFDDTSAAKPWVTKTLDAVVQAQVPLTYWWCYQSDRSDDRLNRQHFDIDRERNPDLLACFVEANKRLQAALNSSVRAD
jgi:hypothetical protein